MLAEDGLYLIHLDDERRTEQKLAAQQQLGIKLNGYIPHNTYVAHLTNEQVHILSELQSKGVVEWYGKVQAQHKYLAANIDKHVR